jgi:hypothetical protein
MESDGKSLTEAQICDLTGVSHQRRKTWVSRGLLRDTPRGGCQRVDALALAEVRLLIDALGSTDGAAAWQQVGSELQACAPPGGVYLLFDTELKLATVLRETSAVGGLIAHGRPVRLVALTERREEIDAAFNRLCAAVERPTGSAA